MNYPFLGTPEPIELPERPLGPDSPLGGAISLPKLGPEEPQRIEIPVGKKPGWFARHVNFERHEVGGEIHRELEQIGWQLDIWRFGCEYIRNRSGVTFGVHAMVGRRRYRVDLDLSRQRVYSDKEMDDGAWVKEECGPWPNTREK